MKPATDVNDLTVEELRDIVTNILHVMYADFSETGDKILNPCKSWGAETLAEIASILEWYELTPTEEEGPPEPLPKLGPNLAIHHIGGNPGNNDPSNLRVVDPRDKPTRVYPEIDLGEEK